MRLWYGGRTWEGLATWQTAAVWAEAEFRGVPGLEKRLQDHLVTTAAGLAPGPMERQKPAQD